MGVEASRGKWELRYRPNQAYVHLTSSSFENTTKTQPRRHSRPIQRLCLLVCLPYHLPWTTNVRSDWQWPCYGKRRSEPVGLERGGREGGKGMNGLVSTAKVQPNTEIRFTPFQRRIKRETGKPRSQRPGMLGFSWSKKTL